MATKIKLTKLEKFAYLNRHRDSHILATELNTTEKSIDSAYNRAVSKIQFIDRKAGLSVIF